MRIAFRAGSVRGDEGGDVHRSLLTGPHVLSRIASAILGVTGAWFLLTRSGDLVAAIGSVASVSPGILPAGLGLVALGVVNRGVQARAAYRIVGIRSRLGLMVQLSASSYATNKVVKSCGAAGLVPFLSDARRRDHNRGKVVAAYASMKLVETISLCLLIALAVVAGAATGTLHGAALVGAAASFVYAIVVIAALILLATRRSAVDRCARFARQFSNRLRTTFRSPQADPGPSAAQEIADTIGRLHSDPVPAAPLLLTAFAGKIIGVACLALVFAGFGVGIGLTATVLVYTLTLMASMVGPLPGGVGVAEASLGGLLVTQGVAAPTATAAVLAFRLLDLWLPLVAGAVAGFVHGRRSAEDRGAPHGDAARRPTPSALPAAIAVQA